MTHVKEWTDQQLNRALAELAGYTVYHYDKDVEENCYYILLNPESDPVLTATSKDWYNGQRETEEEAWLDVPDFCSVPAASLEVQTKALEINSPVYLMHLANCIEGPTSIKKLLLASPRERAEAAYITLQGAVNK